MGEMPDISSILDMLSSMSNTDIPLGSKVEKENSDQANHNSGFEMPDMETMMKIMKMMNTLNSSENNASTNLLNSLRPFLRESKQNKVDQYIKFLKLSNAISQLNIFGGEEK